MAKTVRIFHVSDLHFGREDRATLDWFADETTSEQPDAVICTGDLTWRGTSREFAQAQEWLGSLGVPVSVEPGNHDMPYYWDPLRRLANPYARFRKLREAVHRDLAVDGVRVIPLKTVARAQLRLNWSKGRVGRGVLDAALAMLEEAGDRPLRLVACHHPLVDAGTHSTGSTRGGRQALAALAHAGADAVLSGHVHDAFDRRVEAGGHTIRLIGAGTLSARLRKSPPGYNLLEWSRNSGLDVTVRHRG
ncbi:MAG: metallophosphoesterase [Novosphingobium sp.]